MNKQNSPYQALVALCEIAEIKKNVLDVDQMLGVICAISAAPSQLDLQDWLPCLWAEGQTPSFSNEQLAVEFATAGMQFYDACLTRYQESIALTLPTQRWINESLEITEQGSHFALGYLSGFQSIEQHIEIVEEGKLEQLLQTTTLLLSKIANPSGDNPDMLTLFNQLPEMDEIVSSLPLLLGTLGHFSLQANSHD
jgi:yecA family protein